MSTSVPGSVLAAAEYWASTIRVNNSMTVAALTILYYDFCLTFSAEIEFFWKSASWSIISVLFVVNRYYGLIGSIPLFWEYFGPSSLRCSYRCRRLQTYHQAFAIATQAIVAITLVLRTYALYDRSKRILILLIVTHVGGAVACLIAMVTTKSPTHTKIPLPFNHKHCDQSLTNAQGLHLSFAWLAMLWFDTTIFVLTFVQAIRMRRFFQGGILEMLIRDGSIYYAVMVASNVSNIITFLITPSGSNLKGIETTLTNVLSTTLASRLILNLRDSRRTRRFADNHATEGVWHSTAMSRTASYSEANAITLTEIETQAAYMISTVGDSNEDGTLVSSSGSR